MEVRQPEMTSTRYQIRTNAHRLRHHVHSADTKQHEGHLGLPYLHLLALAHHSTSDYRCPRRGCIPIHRRVAAALPQSDRCRAAASDFTLGDSAQLDCPELNPRSPTESKPASRELLGLPL